MKLKDFLCNTEFYVNCNYRIYNGTWDEGGDIIWDTETDDDITEEACGEYTIVYITLHKNVLIIEVI